MKEVYTRMNNKGNLLGAHFEGKIQTALEGIKKETNKRLWFKRYYDTKSAGAFLPEQPADFQVASGINVWLLEAKASFKKQSLASALSGAVGSGQAVSHKLWARISRPSLFVFLCAETELVEVWDGKLVADTRLKSGARLTPGGYFLKCSLSAIKPEFKQIFMGES